MKKLILIIILCLILNPIAVADDYEMFMNHGSVMLIINPTSGDIVFANIAASVFYKCAIDTLLEMNINDINTLSKLQVTQEMSLAKVQQRNYFNFTHKLCDNSLRDVEVYSYPTTYKGEEMLFSIIIDVTNRNMIQRELDSKNDQTKANLMITVYVSILTLIIFAVLLILITRSNKKLKHISHYDQLTEVFNRTTSRELYNQMLDKKKLPISFYMIDVNNLKFINDAYGHIVGDDMIIQVANLLKSLAGKDGCVSRVSGDEFVVIMCEVSESESEIMNSAIDAALITLKGIRFDVSVGMVIIQKSLSYGMCFSVAESKMYTDKAFNKAKGQHRILSELMDQLYIINPDMKAQTEFIQKVCVYIGHHLNHVADDIQVLLDAAQYQDIGLAVLNSDQDMSYSHPEKSFSILNALGVPYSVSNTVFSHHEFYNGSGYPKGLRGKDIPQSSRILAIANYLYFETRYAGNEQSIMNLAENKLTKFDPEYVDITQENTFLELLNELK